MSLVLRNAKLERWAWVAIYLGLTAIGLGVALDRHGAGFGWQVTTLGAVGVVVGAVLVWLRSRRPDGP